MEIFYSMPVEQKELGKLPVYPEKVRQFFWNEVVGEHVERNQTRIWEIQKQYEDLPEQVAYMQATAQVMNEFLAAEGDAINDEARRRTLELLEAAADLEYVDVDALHAQLHPG